MLTYDHFQSSCESTVNLKITQLFVQHIHLINRIALLKPPSKKEACNLKMWTQFSGLPYSEVSQIVGVSHTSWCRENVFNLSLLYWYLIHLFPQNCTCGLLCLKIAWNVTFIVFIHSEGEKSNNLRKEKVIIKTIDASKCLKEWMCKVRVQLLDSVRNYLPWDDSLSSSCLYLQENRNTHIKNRIIGP